MVEEIEAGIYVSRKDNIEVYNNSSEANSQADQKG